MVEIRCPVNQPSPRPLDMWPLLPKAARICSFVMYSQSISHTPDTVGH